MVAGFGEVLLVVVLGVVEPRAVQHLRGDGLPPRGGQHRLVGRLGGFRRQAPPEGNGRG